MSRARCWQINTLALLALALIVLPAAGIGGLDCTFGDPATDKISLVNNCSTGAIKIRTCRTEIGCTGDLGKWNSFKDCDQLLSLGEQVELSFEQKVAYMVFFNTGDKAAGELWKPKNGTWPAAHVINE